MIISELIEKLNELKEKAGDVPVLAANGFNIVNAYEIYPNSFFTDNFGFDMNDKAVILNHDL